VLGEAAELNVFEVVGNQEAERQTPMFGRGRIDHLGLQAASLEAFDEIRNRLMARGAADDFVTDFGPILSVFFRDPDGLEGEVCVANPDAVPGAQNPPVRSRLGTLHLDLKGGGPPCTGPGRHQRQAWTRSMVGPTGPIAMVRRCSR